MIVYLLSCVLCATGVIAALPNGWTACRTSSPDYKECSIKAITNAIRSLKQGNPQLGLPPLDPLRKDELILDHPDDQVNLYIKYNDVLFKGFGDIEIQDFRNDWKKMMLKGNIDNIEFEGIASINGTVLSRPIMGTKTPFNYRYEGVTVTMNADLSEVNRNGKTYFQVDKMNFHVDVNHAYWNYENLFNGDKALRDSMIQFINDNWKLIADATTPGLEYVLGEGFLSISNLVFSKIPSNELNIK